MTDSQHSLAVVIVAWNSREQLSRALPAVLRELREGDELIVVDNASADGTPDLVRELAPEAILVRHIENRGFAAGANAGARAARAELLVLLNPDAVPEPGFGAAIRRPLEEGRWSAWMGLVTADGGQVVNTSGGVLHFTGIAWAGDAGRPAATPPPSREVTFLSGACMAVPRAVWQRAGGFCERYFLYHEDVDLSLRLRLAGERLGIEPSAVVDHAYDFHGPGKYRHLERNRWSTLLRTYPAALLAVLAPALVLTELALVAISIAGGWGRQKLGANLDVIRTLPQAMRERRAIQEERRISAAGFASHLTPDLDSAYLGRAAGAAPLRWALRAYWAVARLLLGRAASTGNPPEGGPTPPPAGRRGPDPARSPASRL